MRKRIFAVLAAVVLVVSVLSGCGKEEKVLKVAATSVPHAEMLKEIENDLKKEGITLEVMVVEDYNVPNRALAEKEVDANFFQHYPYMEAQVKEFSYEITDMAKIHIEPMGLYSKKIQSLDEIKDQGVIAIPNDPTNEARALALLHRNGIIELDDVENREATVLNIKNNPKNLTIQEIDAAMLPRVLEDVDAAVINTNFALQAELSPLEDAIVMEGADSPFVNILTIRKGDEEREDLKALVKALTSEKMKKFLEEKYKGAVVPVF